MQSQLRSEQRALEKEMRQIDQASNKAKAEVKSLAKKGDVKSARILARELVRTKKQKDRLAVSKARLNSIGMQLQHQMGESWSLGRMSLLPAGIDLDLFFAAMYKVTGSMQKSTEVMKLSNQLVKLPQLQRTMRDMSSEMMKVKRPD